MSRSLAALLILPAFFWAATPLAAQPAAVVRALLDDAAERFAIPRPILYGVAYNESRWVDIPADSLEPSCTGMPPAYGIMGLHDDDYFGHSLAAGLPLGITPEEARRSIEKNILAGAYHLASLFDGTDRTDIREWTGAIGRYSGIPDTQPALQLLYADGVLELLRRGWGAGDQSIAPQQVPTVDRARLADELEPMGLVVAQGADAVPDYSEAVWRPSPNFSARGAAITAITIHDTEGGFAGSLSWLTSTQSQASAHYMVRSVDGYTVQMVKESEKAWHVRTENPYTIGIEHEGYVARPEFFTPAMYRASSDLVRYLTGKYNIPLERSRVKGHLDFPNNTHTDPGGWWDWAGYYRLIKRSPGARIVLDPFEDNVVGWWQPGMSGSTTKADTVASRFVISPNAAHGGKNGAELSYAFTESSGGQIRLFRSGHGNTSDGLLNVGTSGYVTLMVKGDGSGHELELWFYDNQKGNKPLRAGAIIWSGWRMVSVPVGSLGSEGPFRFHSVVLRQVAGKKRNGTIAIDELAHESTASGVEMEEDAERAVLPKRIAVSIGDPLPAPLRELGAVRIISALGGEVARYDRLPDTPVGSYLAPGIYLVVAREEAWPLLVSP